MKQNMKSASTSSAYSKLQIYHLGTFTSLVIHSYSNIYKIRAYTQSFLDISTIFVQDRVCCTGMSSCIFIQAYSHQSQFITWQAFFNSASSGFNSLFVCNPLNNSICISWSRIHFGYCCCFVFIHAASFT